MGVKIQNHVWHDERLYVFVLNGLGEEYTAIFSERDEEDNYQMEYLLLPRNEWDGELFQEAMEVREETFEYLRKTLGGEILDHCLSPTQQLIPEEYWDELEIDLTPVTDDTVTIDSSSG